MKNIIIFLLLFVCFAGKAFAAAEAADTVGMAVDFSLEDLNGKIVSLADFRGKENVLLFFWTTWCPHCRDNIVRMSKEKESFLKDNLRVITININESTAKVNGFLEKHSLAVPVLMDTDASVAALYSVLGVPTFILVDKAGKIVFNEHYFPDDFREMISNKK